MDSSTCCEAFRFWHRVTHTAHVPDDVAEVSHVLFGELGRVQIHCCRFAVVESGRPQMPSGTRNVRRPHIAGSDTNASKRTRFRGLILNCCMDPKHDIERTFAEDGPISADLRGHGPNRMVGRGSGRSYSRMPIEAPSRTFWLRE
jgi:hypothetical protein